ncbi:MFS transporter [Pseudobacteriovorax antillogorgiicola]|uniref:MFS transporter, NNP family, nitrate/nitrite transporter n=1 Tax=Pseudobacteriovorax antillogorgiicola TaxID=1513793 RepID=A0A1Y6BV34_9BACT|nr:MFS transporter [Pseudobacteriovorax antillogorgiicola]TCS52326.1 NNP family nitrate/nitrite transporter-like MFS transporter [Pseudobacteriovorax antillogorgiicola]SMF29985.1 MFS transporter, NNP family, nitrate/nitrite transporter [Pseudobacteriovorax antillogorgiicola]
MEQHKAGRLNLTDFKSVPMRTFHITWLSFFMCFFAWFGIAPLMAVVRDEFSLTKSQIGTIIVASVSATVIMRLLLGYVCDRIGPRKTYTYLLAFGSIPVFGIAFSNSYETFLIARLLIGCIGASFVLTQYHTSVMFTSRVVGTANATSAGWGNLGGGVTQMVMPLVFTGFLGLGFAASMSWRLSMVVTAFGLLLCAFLYFRYTQDFPQGNWDELKDERKKDLAQHIDGESNLKELLKDYRIWLLFVIYGACFGMELTINNVAALYYIDRFGLDLKSAGLMAGLFGLMNIFARSLGGVWADRFGVQSGLKGRVRFLALILFLEGAALLLFSSMDILWTAVFSMIIFSLCVQMAEGATYAVVPFINRKHLGVVSGIVGAGGNMGAVVFGFLFRSESLSYGDAFGVLGIFVMAVSFAVPLIRFSPEKENFEKEVMARAMAVKSP